MAVSAADKIQDVVVGLAIQASRLEADVRLRVLGWIERLDEEVSSILTKADIEAIQRPGMKMRAAERAIEKIRKAVRRAYAGVKRVSQTEMREVAVALADAFVANTAAEVGAPIFRRGLSLVDLRSLADDHMVQGAPMKDWWSKQSTNTQTRIATQIRMGVLAGETNDQIEQRLLGQRTGRTRMVEILGKRVRVPVKDAGAVVTSRNEAQALTRTAVASLNNSVNEAVFRANDDVVQAMQAVAVLDGRTTPICLERDGGEWDLETGQPTKDSTVDIDFPGAPPWHWLCRTVLVPILLALEDIVKRATGQRQEMFERLPQPVRATLDGAKPVEVDSQAWLKGKSAAFARRLLGPGRYDLWSRGKITTHQLLDQTGRPLRVAELRAKFDT